MSVPSNLRPQDRLAALRFATDALTKLESVYLKWILWAETRPYAEALKPVNEHLQRLTTMLADATADHYIVGHDLGVICAQLMVMNDEAVLKALMDVASARQKIVGDIQ